LGEESVFKNQKEWGGGVQGGGWGSKIALHREKFADKGRDLITGILIAKGKGTRKQDKLKQLMKEMLSNLGTRHWGLRIQKKRGRGPKNGITEKEDGLKGWGGGKF